ncbi:MAG: hypothetical protein WKF81_14290 [Thermomicrobiales bacterium]
MPPETDSTVSTTSGNEGGRPLAVYGVLVVGVATLLILLAVIYFSSGDRDRPDQPTCINMTSTEAIDAVYNDRVATLTLNYDAMGDPTSGERYGPVLAKVDFVDGQCGNLPQGIENLGQVYELIGVIQFFNETTERSRIEIRNEGSETLAESLYFTPTAIPTETPIATETPLPTETPAATEEPPLDPTPEPTTVPATPESSPDASPAS